MQLITIAHLGEAQSIIEKFNLSKVSDSLYKSDKLACLITGEGPFEAAIRTAAELQHEDYQEVMNLGICGTLTKDLVLESIHEVRSIYLAIDGKPQFRSFPISEKGIDLLTSFERILDPHKAEKLRGVAGLVDREAWGVAFACKEAKVKLRVFKMVSDIAGSLEACELVKEKAPFFSLKLAEFLKENVGIQDLNPPEEGLDLGKEFYFTFSSSHRFKITLEKLSLLRGVFQAELIKSFPLDELRERKLSPKERTKLLLEIMDDELDPFRGAIKKKIIDFKKPWEEKGIRIQIDPHLEDEKIQVCFDVTHPDDYKQKLEDLNGLELNSVYKIFKGEIDVE